MAKKVCVFVDGENFRHSIVNLFEQFNPNDYLPKNADWDALFDWFVSKAVPEGERVRTYWYVIQLLDFFPYRFPSVQSNPDGLRRLLSKDKQYKKKLNSTDSKKVLIA